MYPTTSAETTLLAMTILRVPRIGCRTGSTLPRGGLICHMTGKRIRTADQYGRYDDDAQAFGCKSTATMK